MKVLLVNTLQKPNTAVSSCGTVSSVNSTLTTRSIVNIQPKIQVTAASQSTYQTRSATAASQNAAANGTTPISAKKFIYATSSAPAAASVAAAAAERRAASWKYPKNAPGFRTLLHQLVQLQNKTLDVSRQRLDVEKQRLTFERETGEKILDVLSTLLQQRNDK